MAEWNGGEFKLVEWPCIELRVPNRKAPTHRWEDLFRLVRVGRMEQRPPVNELRVVSCRNGNRSDRSW
jgi:hypothetical protein